MNILDVVKTVGAGLAAMHPLGALAVGAVNAFLPDDGNSMNDARIYQWAHPRPTLEEL